MKKRLFSLILILATVCSASAQDIDQLMADLAKEEGIQHQIIDKETLQKQLGQAMDADSSGQLKSTMPSFLNKVELIETVISPETQDNLKNKFVSELSSMKKEGYESLLKVKKEEAIVEILSKKKDDNTDVYIVVIADKVIVALKMSGTFTEQDLLEIVEEQKKNN